VLEPVSGSEQIPAERTVCVTHDIERGSGHRDTDPELARRADATGQQALEAMLGIEDEQGVSATYNVVGELLDEVRRPIEANGHALAFHSFDHGNGDQLLRCREVDYRLKGYRLPRSEHTDETTNERLAFHNFEWVAEWRPRLEEPELRDRLVNMPVHFDDYRLYTRDDSYQTWEAKLLEHVEQASCTVLGLHDCYGDWWLERYPELLRKLGDRARLRTLDEVSADVFMSAAA
jgi:hypothetical protein